MWAFVENLDYAILHGINGMAGHSALADLLVAAISANDLLKGGFVMALWWGLWFSMAARKPGNRERLVATIVVAMAAVAVGRGLQVTLPFRFRPIHDLSVEANMTLGMAPKLLDGWSSMPSDHAVLYFALATGLLRVCPRIGTVALCHAALWVCLPRIYLGLHYPSDVGVGALLGILLSWLLMRPAYQVVHDLRICEMRVRWPQYFYPALFLMTFQITEMFGGVRAFGRTIIRAIQMGGT
jgi:undecaprenyl-diphosphatase